MNKNKKESKGGGSSSINIKPMGDRVVLKIDSNEGEKKNSFGLIIPDTANKERPEYGEVVAVGDGKITDEGTLVPMRVKVGDTVLFSKYGYDEVKVNGKDYLIVTENSILAIIG